MNNTEVENVYVGKNCNVNIKFTDGSVFMIKKHNIVEIFKQLKEIGVIENDC